MIMHEPLWANSSQTGYIYSVILYAFLAVDSQALVASECIIVYRINRFCMKLHNSFPMHVSYGQHDTKWMREIDMVILMLITM